MEVAVVAGAAVRRRRLLKSHVLPALAPCGGPCSTCIVHQRSCIAFQKQGIYFGLLDGVCTVHMYRHISIQSKRKSRTEHEAGAIPRCTPCRCCAWAYRGVQRWGSTFAGAGAKAVAVALLRPLCGPSGGNLRVSMAT